MTSSSTASGAADRIADDLRLRLVDRHVDVLLAVRGRRRDRDREVVDSCRSASSAPLAFGTSAHNVTSSPRERGRGRDDVAGTGHRRHRLRRHERGDLDVAESGSKEPLDQLDAACGLDGSFPLQPIRGATSRMLTDVMTHPPTQRVSRSQVVPR